MVWMHRVYEERNALHSYCSLRPLFLKYVSAGFEKELRSIFDKVVVVSGLRNGRHISHDAERDLSKAFRTESKRLLKALNKDIAETISTPINPLFKCDEKKLTPQEAFRLKRLGGKVLVYAELDKKALAEAVKSFPNLNVDFPIRVTSQSFSKEDVNAAARSMQSITIPGNANVDYAVAEMLAGEPICKRACVERFINWAVDELKKETRKEFVIAVRNKLRGS